jgi:hypothetical protein
MVKKASIQKSLVEQILDQMFIDIEKRAEFNTSLIQNLEQLASAGELTKAKQVIEAIKGLTEGT